MSSSNDAVLFWVSNEEDAAAQTCTWAGDASHTAGQHHDSSLPPKPTGTASLVTCQLAASASVIGWEEHVAKQPATRGDDVK